MSTLLSLLLTKGHSWQKSDSKKIALDFFIKDQHQWFIWDSSKSLPKKPAICSKKHMFWQISQFSPFSSKERPWAIRSRRSWQKSDREWFAPVAQDKKRQERFALFHERIGLFRSFAHKKWGIRSKNRWGKSQPWVDKTLNTTAYTF